MYLKLLIIITFITIIWWLIMEFNIAW